MSSIPLFWHQCAGKACSLWGVCVCGEWQGRGGGGVSTSLRVLEKMSAVAGGPCVTCVLWCGVQVDGNPDKLDVGGLWGTYQAGRLVRAAAIHGMARE